MLRDKVDWQKVLDAAADRAVQDDWSCVRRPEAPGLPGLRYGSGLEVRPTLALLPCACAGGVRSRPGASDEAVLGPGGVWASWHDMGGVVLPPVAPARAPPADGDDFGEDPPHGVGTEPYSADYGCAQGASRRSPAWPQRQVDSASGWG